MKFIEEFGQDVRSSVRSLLRSPGFTIVVVLTLALGMFGVHPTDTATQGMVIIVIMLVAAAACWVPAWRASRRPECGVSRRLMDRMGGNAFPHV